MSKNSLHKIDQKEYLKKYLSGDKVKKKKKEKKHKKSSSYVKVKIIDDDVNHLDTGPQIDEELLLTGDDAPQIVGEYIEENPAENNIPKWRSIGIKEEPQDKQSSNEDELWGKKSIALNTKNVYSVSKKHSEKTPDHSPLRRKANRREDSSSSPPRRRHKSPSLQRKNKKEKSTHSRRRSNDISPDYRNKIKREPITPDKSPPRRRQVSGNDFSRDSRNFSHKADYSPPRRNHESSSDRSPPRKSRNRLNDQSPLRKTKHYEQPPHRKRTKRSPDQSPRRDRNSRQSPSQRNRYHITDQSPPRKYRNDSPYTSPPRRKRNNSDQSPQRRSKKCSPDQSPIRNRQSLDQSPPRKGKNNATDLLPPRRKRSSDQSPPRRNLLDSPLPAKHIKRERLSPDLTPRRHSRWEQEESEKSLSPPPSHKPKPIKTLEGKKAGLQDAQALHKESLERRKQEGLLFEKMSSEISGRHAEVQVRSTGRRGRRAREANAEDPEERKRKEEHEEKKKQLYDRWGKGLKQIEDHKNRLLEQAHESSKPLARYEDDEDLERHLKEQERAEDPMLEYMRQKRKEKEKQSGKPQLPRYKGPYPENRFGIRPGYRWDGVDRSNGYEKKYFSVQNEKRAKQDEAYKYSVEDM